MTRALAIATVIALAPAPATAADCMEMSVAAQLLTHGGDVLPAGGGVLIGWQASSTEPRSTSDPADHADWRFVTLAG